MVYLAYSHSRPIVVNLPMISGPLVLWFYPITYSDKWLTKIRFFVGNKSLCIPMIYPQRLHNELENHNFEQVNQLFLWGIFNSYVKNFTCLT